MNSKNQKTVCVVLLYWAKEETLELSMLQLENSFGVVFWVQDRHLEVQEVLLTIGEIDLSLPQLAVTQLMESTVLYSTRFKDLLMVLSFVEQERFTELTLTV